MRENLTSISEVKAEIQNLLGKNINMEVNRGRNKIVKLCAKIDKVYPSMFVITPSTPNLLDRNSYSYNDVLCGDVVFCDE